MRSVYLLSDPAHHYHIRWGGWIMDAIPYTAVGVAEWWRLGETVDGEQAARALLIRLTSNTASENVGIQTETASLATSCWPSQSTTRKQTAFKEPSTSTSLSVCRETATEQATSFHSIGKQLLWTKHGAVPTTSHATIPSSALELVDEAPWVFLLAARKEREREIESGAAQPLSYTPLPSITFLTAMYGVC